MTTETDAAATEPDWSPAKAKAYMRRWIKSLAQEIRDLRENMQEWGDSEEEFRLGLLQCLGESEYGTEYHAARAKGMTIEQAEAVADCATTGEE